MADPRERTGRPTAWRVGDVVDGRYEVVEVIGRGGMGVVHRVRHLGWGVDLAVKSPRSALVRHEAARELFRAEAETWVSLGSHPHVCTCHYVRTVDGVPRVFAEYAPGGSLRGWIDDGRLHRGDRREVLARQLDLAVQLAWGLEHAHRRGLVHQDVKPDNVLLDGSGTAKITDFGLALVREGIAALPGASTPVPGGGGTPRYASPEQAEGRPVGRRTDVYSYAVSVLEVFTGGATWDSGPDAGAALERYRTDGGPIPSVVADLLAECLRSDPARRPGSMADIAAALTEAYRDVVGVPHPRRAPREAELRADEFTNRALSLVDLGRGEDAEAALAEALAADPQHVPARYNAGLQRWRRGDITDVELVTELEALRADRGEPWEATFLLAQVHTERGDLAAARALLEGLPPEWAEEPDVRATLRAVDELPDARCTDEWRIAWPPYPDGGPAGGPATEDPATLEAARQALLSAPPGLDALPARPHDDAALALTPDGRWALTGTWDGAVRVWDVRTGGCLRVLDGHRDAVRSVDLTPDGRFAASLDVSGTVCFWDLADGRGALRCPDPSPHGGSGTQLARVGVRPDGRTACWTSSDGTVTVLDTRERRLRRGRPPHLAHARQVRPSPSGDVLLVSGGVGGRAESVVVWDPVSDTCHHVLTGHTSYVTAICVTADGRFAATGSHDRTIRVWDLADGSCVRVLSGHTADSLSLSGDARSLLSGDAFDGTVRFWDVGTGRCVRTFPGHATRTGAVVLDPECAFALSAGQDRTVRRWRLPAEHRAAPSLARPRPHTELTRLGERVRSLVADAERAVADQRFAAALDLLSRARTVSGHQREPRVLAAWWALSRHCPKVGLRAAWTSRVLAGHDGAVEAVDVSADGRTAVSGGADGTVRAWSVATGACTRVFHGHEHLVESVSLSPDGRQVLSGSRDGTVRWWSVEDGECLGVLGAPRGLGDSPRVRFTADGERAVVAHPDAAVRVWELGTGRERGSLRASSVSDIALSSTGLVAVAEGRAVQLWDPRTAGSRMLHAEFLHTMRSVCLSADGRLALTGEAEGIRLWDTASGRLVRVFGTGDLLTDTDRHHFLRTTATADFAVSAGFRAPPVVWDVTTGRRLRTLDDHEQGVTALAMTPDGRFVLTASGGGTVRVRELDWDLAAPRATSSPPRYVH